MAQFQREITTMGQLCAAVSRIDHLLLPDWQTALGWINHC